MRRRALLAGVGAALLAGAAPAHTLYGQWVVYRKKHLLVGCHRKDPETYALAKAVVEAFETFLPEARARVARAPFPGRIASLLATDQLEIAVLSAPEAEAMVAGRDGFAPYGPVPMGLLADLGPRLLVARAAFPARHAWLTRAALGQSGMTLPGAGRSPIPLHPGAAAFDSGLALSALPETGAG